MLYDSHAHLNSDYFEDGEREEFMAKTLEAVESGLLSYVNDIGCDLASSKIAYDNAQKYPWCYAAVGCHPHETQAFDETQLMFIKNLAMKDKVQAIGEIGLDFYYDHSPRDEQRYWFRRQIQLANELKMPLVIHSREADQECLDILKEEGAFSDLRKSYFSKRPAPGGEMIPDARVLLHCFSGSAELAKQYVKLGATLSMAGPITYKNNRRGVEVVTQIPVEFLLVETDSPFLTPVPHRGKKNCPAYVEHTARRMAVIKEMEFETLARITCENAKRFFDIK